MDSHWLSYEEVPYQSRPFYYAQPDCLATVALLFGLEPPLVGRCRVLELGCAAGGHLIPLGLTLPESRFVGVDFSPRQIAEGRAWIQEIGLENVELRAANILEVDDSFGRFDYVIAHGVFSWVPHGVQEKIFSICAELLAPNGVAYISYNTYPGWHASGMMREMMAFHARHATGPGERVRHARALLDFLSREVTPKSVFGHVIEEETRLLGRCDDSQLLHDHLEVYNEPLYFHQFARRAEAQGLQYLGEAKFSDMAGNLSAEQKRQIAEWSDDLIDIEQYVDLLAGRTFRRSLLCHAAARPHRSPGPDTVRRLKVRTQALPLSRVPDLHGTAVEQFQNSDGVKLSTNNPLLKTALITLLEHSPRALAFEELHAAVLDRLADFPDAAPFDREPDYLARALLQCLLSGLVNLHTHAPKIATEVSERPVASPVARIQARGDGLLTNLFHVGIELNDFERLVVRHLDGSRDRSMLLERLAEADAGETVDPPPQGDRRQELDRHLDLALRHAVRSALLIA